MDSIPSGVEERRSPPQMRSDWALKFSNRHADTAVVMNDEVSTATVIHAVEATAREGEILTVMEVARFLRVPKSTVYKLARVGELPASKIGKHWRFLRRDIHEWMHGRSRQGERSASRSLLGSSAE